MRNQTAGTPVLVAWFLCSWFLCSLGIPWYIEAFFVVHFGTPTIPIETLDHRDVLRLTDMIRAVAEGW
jgi:hypothetical protein